MKRITLAVVAAIAFSANASLAQCAIVLLDSTGDPSTGDNLDGIIEPTSGITVPELPGLNVAVTAVTGTGNVVINSTGTSLGLNSDGDDDTDAFDADFSESLTLQFDQDVEISALDLTNFEAGDVFHFMGQSISEVDNGTTDEIAFDPAISIPANTDFIISATVGTVGIESMTVTAAAVPEPQCVTTVLLAGIGLLALRRSRKR